MNLGRILAMVAAATLFVASSAVAQSPSPSAAATPTASPSATPFPWPTIPRERLARGTFPEWPSVVFSFHPER